MADPTYKPDVISTDPVPDSEVCSITDVGCLADWFLDQVASLGLWFFEKILDGLAAVVESIPVPSWASNIGNLHIPSEIGWFAEAFQLNNGVAILVSAYTLRFIIRRIPVIG